MKQLNVRMPEDLIQALKALAAENERSIAGELRTLIRKQIKARWLKGSNQKMTTESTTPAR